ncbi:MAG: dodecin domain-containing protein [Candidatus Lokiarchaeota archaeon]|nr:dodecin domain-containing protein [Candidatus Lokiarchaeota archaeon]
MTVAKVIELVGVSTESFDDAIESALKTASKSIRNIHGLDVISMNCDIEDGKIVRYKVNLKAAFGYEE